jgi:hypothetical protein
VSAAGTSIRDPEGECNINPTMPPNWLVPMCGNLQDDVPLNVSYVALHVLDPSK